MKLIINILINELLVLSDGGTLVNCLRRLLLKPLYLNAAVSTPKKRVELIIIWGTQKQCTDLSISFLISSWDMPSFVLPLITENRSHLTTRPRDNTLL